MHNENESFVDQQAEDEGDESDDEYEGDDQAELLLQAKFQTNKFVDKDRLGDHLAYDYQHTLDLEKINEERCRVNEKRANVLQAEAAIRNGEFLNRIREEAAHKRCLERQKGGLTPDSLAEIGVWTGEMGWIFGSDENTYRQRYTLHQRIQHKKGAVPSIVGRTTSQYKCVKCGIACVLCSPFVCFTCFSNSHTQSTFTSTHDTTHDTTSLPHDAEEIEVCPNDACPCTSRVAREILLVLKKNNLLNNPNSPKTLIVDVGKIQHMNQTESCSRYTCSRCRVQCCTSAPFLCFECFNSTSSTSSTSVASIASSASPASPAFVPPPASPASAAPPVSSASSTSPTSSASSASSASGASGASSASSASGCRNDSCPCTSRVAAAILKVLDQNKQRYGAKAPRSLFVDLAPKDGKLLTAVGLRHLSCGFTQDKHVAQSYDQARNIFNQARMYYAPTMSLTKAIKDGCDTISTDISAGEANVLAHIQFFWADPSCGQLFVRNVPPNSSIVTVARGFNMSLKCVGLLHTPGCPDTVFLYQRDENRRKKRKTHPSSISTGGVSTSCRIARGLGAGGIPRQETVTTKFRIITGEAYTTKQISYVLQEGRHIWDKNLHADMMQYYKQFQQSKPKPNCPKEANDILQLVSLEDVFLDNFNTKYAPAAIRLYELLMKHGDGIHPADPSAIYPQAKIGTELFVKLTGLVKLGAYIYRTPALFLLPSLSDFAQYGQILINESDVMISLLHDPHLDFTSRKLFPPWYLKCHPPFTQLHEKLKKSIQMSCQAMAFFSIRASVPSNPNFYCMWRSGGKHAIGQQCYLCGPGSVDIHDPDGCRVSAAVSTSLPALAATPADPGFGDQHAWQDSHVVTRLYRVVLALGAVGIFCPQDTSDFRARRGNAPEFNKSRVEWRSAMAAYTQLMTPTWNRYLIGFVDAVYPSRAGQPNRAYTMFSTVDWTMDEAEWVSVEFNMAKQGYYFECNVPVPRPRLISEMFQTYLSDQHAYSEQERNNCAFSGLHNNNSWSDETIASCITNFSWRCAKISNGTCSLLRRRPVYGDSVPDTVPDIGSSIGPVSGSGSCSCSCPCSCT